jgi:hypothetical protein
MSKQNKKRTIFYKLKVNIRLWLINRKFKAIANSSK